MKIFNLLFVMILLMTPLVSCAQKIPPKPGMNQPDMKPSTYEGEVFYNIHEDGSVSAVDSQGNKIELEKVKIPFKHDIKEIKSIKQITILELRGSLYELVCTSPHYCYLRRK